ncbi:hypothetical protein [Streptomyces sp. NPDC006739]|uniref:hypothetical protein n=1 Tax=Streptomyces sp. NPDC006739 TaxID=3364763 RepID=UPI00369792A1
MLASSPDGTALAYGVSAPGREAAVAARPVTVWDTARRRSRAMLDLPGDPLLEAALGPGGRTLYAFCLPHPGRRRPVQRGVGHGGPPQDGGACPTGGRGPRPRADG